MVQSIKNQVGRINALAQSAPYSSPNNRTAVNYAHELADAIDSSPAHRHVAHHSKEMRRVAGQALQNPSRFNYEALLKVARQLAASLLGGMDQKTLAARLGVSRSHANKVELAQQYLSVGEFIEWCRVIGVEPAEVLKRLPKD